MPSIARSAAVVAALGLLVVAATQVMYVGLGASGTPLARALWTTETIVFLAIAIAGAAMLAARPLVGAALATGGLLNVIQSGMGLVMFGPLRDGGEALGLVFQAVLAMAFLLYFAGKVAFGVAGIALGRALFQAENGMGRIAGVAAGLSGLAALAVNLLATAAGREYTWPAGVTGTVAEVLLALALLVLTRRPAD